MIHATIYCRQLGGLVSTEGSTKPVLLWLALDYLVSQTAFCYDNQAERRPDLPTTLGPPGWIGTRQHGERSQVVQGACLWHRRSRVRIPSLAPNGFTRQLAPVAQRIEYWASDPGVVGSNPARRANSRHEISPLKQFRGLSFLYILLRDPLGGDWLIGRVPDHLCWHSPVGRRAVPDLT